MLNWDERDVNTVSHGDVQKSTVPVVVKLRGQGRVKCVCMMPQLEKWLGQNPKV